MRVLITGATSGIGETFLEKFISRGDEVIAVGRNLKKLNELKVKYQVETLAIDLAKEENIYKLYENAKDIDILINNAGFGNFGYFSETDLTKDLEMISVNIKALHMLTKLYLSDFIKKNHGYILNVGSIGGFIPGPLMATYYATKAYVVSLTESIAIELKKMKASVYIGALCPGPIQTHFFENANASFVKKGASKEEIVNYAIKMMFKGKNIIIPKFSIKCSYLANKILPESIVGNMVYKIQNRRSQS